MRLILPVLAALLLTGCNEAKAPVWSVTETAHGAVLLDTTTGRTWLLQQNDMGGPVWYPFTGTGLQ